MSQISPIEQHVAAVRRKMIFQRFLRYVAVALLVAGGVAWATALVLRLFALNLPGGGWVWLAGGVALVAVVALLWALRKAPTDHEAAVAIDERLGLKEKFSTALVIAGDSDPFAQLAVADALRTSGRVDLRRKFPLSWPKTFYGVPAWALLILLTLWLVPALKFAETAQAGEQAQQKQQEKVQAEAERIIQQTTNALAALPQEVAEREEFRVARDQLAQARETLTRDPAKARQTAKEAQKELSDALKNQIERGEQYAQAKENARTFRNMTPPEDAQGPVADAHRAMANADFDKAMEKLEEAVKDFEKMTAQEKEKQAEQMQQLAQALQQMANNPQQQQQMQQQQLQQMGVNQQQAQQMQQQMEKAAQGDQQAAQQLQQMAQQAMQQMNNGQGPTQQQQQQMQQMMQQMQQQANSQATAQQMQQMAQQMAQAMQQAAQQGQGQQASQQPGGGQGQQQQGGSQGQQAAAGQGMQSANAQMQDTLSQMQAAQQAAQQMQAAQNMGQGGEGDGQGQGQQGQGQQAGTGQWQPGDPQDPGAGMGGPGQGQGGAAPYAPAPYGVKQEVSKSHDEEDGRVIASTLIKAEALKGESKAEIQRIVESETKEATDEVDQQRVSRQAQRAVREYFQSMAKDAGAAPAPAAEGAPKPAEEPAQKPAQAPAQKPAGSN